jgi:hypothetical protein
MFRLSLPAPNNEAHLAKPDNQGRSASRPGVDGDGLERHQRNEFREHAAPGAGSRSRGAVGLRAVESGARIADAIDAIDRDRRRRHHQPLLLGTGATHWLDCRFARLQRFALRGGSRSCKRAVGASSPGGASGGRRHPGADGSTVDVFRTAYFELPTPGCHGRPRNPRVTIRRRVHRQSTSGFGRDAAHLVAWSRPSRRGRRMESSFQYDRTY